MKKYDSPRVSECGYMPLQQLTMSEEYLRVNDDTEGYDPDTGEPLPQWEWPTDTGSGNPVPPW